VLSGCGGPASSVFNHAAPLSADAIIPYNLLQSGVVGLRARDGATAWRAATGEGNPHWAPLVVGGVLYIEGGAYQPPMGTLAAVRLSDGHVLWQASLPTRDFTIRADGATVVVAAGASGLYALDAATGAVRWRLDGEFDGPLQISRGVVVLTIPNSNQTLLELVAVREADGARLWTSPINPNGPIAATQTAVYTSENTLLRARVSALSLTTGRPLWEVSERGFMVALNDRLVILSGLEQMIALDASTGRVVWRSNARLDVVSTPDMDISAMRSPDATMFYGVRPNAVLALRASDGTQVWRTAFTDSNYAEKIQLAVEDGVMFALLSDGPESSTPARLVALDGQSGAIYWERDLGVGDVTYLADVAPSATSAPSEEDPHVSGDSGNLAC